MPSIPALSAAETMSAEAVAVTCCVAALLAVPAAVSSPLFEDIVAGQVKLLASSYGKRARNTACISSYLRVGT